MIVDHLSKINVIRPDSANQDRYCLSLKVLGPLGVILVVALVLCQSSSTQEAANSSKSPPAAKKEARGPKTFEALGRFEDSEITESSGVVKARPAADGTASNSIWTFNDSGGRALLYRVSIKADATKGRTEATLKLTGAKNRDWETMCSFTIGEERFLAVGDVGDNMFWQKSYEIYVVPEPSVTPKISKKGKLKLKELKSKADKIQFKYDDGSHNCEAMSYNSDDDTFWFVEKVYVDDKRKTAPGIYVLPNPMTADESEKKKKPKNVARRIADFPVRNVTGMAFSTNNRRLVIRNYFGAWLYEKAEGKTWQETVVETKAKTIALPLQSQGEAICFGADGQSLLVTSELKNAIIWKTNLDQVASKEKNESEK